MFPGVTQYYYLALYPGHVEAKYYLTSHHFYEGSMTHLFQFCRRLLGREQSGKHAQVLKILPLVTFWEMDNNSTCEKLGI